MNNIRKNRFPVIGCIPLWDEKKDSLWMYPGYMEMLIVFHAVPIMFPLTADRKVLDECFDLCDGILFTGGHDINPSRYGESQRERCGVTCSLRDQQEYYLIERAMDADKPMLGICRGIQLFNVFLGGTLYQDLQTENPSRIVHCMQPPYDKIAHEVSIVEGSKLHNILKTERLGVNSYHHQAIRKIALDLTPMAYADDGIVEAVSVDNRHFAIAVQWHPEFSFRTDVHSQAIVKAFVDAAAENVR